MVVIAREPRPIEDFHFLREEIYYFCAIKRKYSQITQ